ncbi:HD domain-containing protein [Candidatus Dependentiae bacterium]|nr:HD domain-containing protein [Candidatus Dependentiae bacterium]
MKKSKVKKSNTYTIGLIDITMDSVRLNISETMPKDKLRKIEELWVPVSLGKDIFSHGQITNNTINDLIKIIKNFQELLTSYKVENFKTIAVSNLKEAGNLDTMIDRVLNETDIKIELIEPVVETELIIENIKKIISDKNSDILIIVLGVGTTILILQSKGKIVFSETQNIGAARMVKTLDIQKKSMDVYYNYLSTKFLTSLNFLPENHKNIDKFVVVNEDILNCLKKTGFGKNAESFRFTKLSFQKYVKSIDKLSNFELQSVLKSQEDNVKTVKISLSIIQKISLLIDAKSIIIPDMNRTIALINKLPKLKDNCYAEFTDITSENIITGALEIGHKYKFDYEHSEHVRKLSKMIFNGMFDFYNFEPKAGIYLEVASLLHDIGYFVSSKGHHKHSANLITASEILGLTAEDMIIIAQIARYHRKSPPKPEHSAYSVLPVNKRLIISSLAAILRISDALDRSHTQLIESLRVNICENECELFIKIKSSYGDHIEILRDIVLSKSDLFESFFGLTLKLSRE